MTISSTSLLRVLLASAVLLAGCTVAPVRDDTRTTQFLHDEAFPASANVALESEADVFELDEDARRWMDANVRSVGDMKYRQRLLVDAIFDQTALDITYDSTANTTASETFRRKSANCLSLTILAHAMSEYAGFEARFQEVTGTEFWERRDQLSIGFGHVNLRIEDWFEDDKVMVLISSDVEVDFQRPAGAPRLPAHAIPQSRVLAMFYNNKGVDALLKGDPNRAYAYLRAALQSDPQLDMALANLGLLYGRHGRMDWAELNFREAMRINPRNTAAAKNLADILRGTGRVEEAGDVLARVQSLQQDNPFYFFVQGESAYDAGDWENAIRSYRKSIALDPDVSHFYLGLAKTYYRMGDMENAGIWLQRAERHAADLQDRERYRSKLDALASMQ